MKELIRGLAWLSFAIAGLLFWVGGRAFAEFGHMDRLLGEILGLALAAVFAAIGMVAKNAGEPDEDGTE